MTAETASHSLTIRRAFPEDERDLRRLAALDSTLPLSGDVLLAEIEGELHAAVGVENGKAIADPFRRTADVVDMLRLRAGRLAAPAGTVAIRPIHRSWAHAR